MAFKIAFKIADKDTKFFWTKTKQTSEKQTYFNPVSEDPIQFWAEYVRLMREYPNEFQDHIQYSNDGKKGDLNWNSGITIDSDIYFEADESIISRLVECGCGNPLFCDKCKENAANACAEYGAAEDKTDFMHTFLDQHPYVPSTSEIRLIHKICEDIITQITECLDIPPDEAMEAREHIILLRKNAQFRADHPDKDGNPCLRYGFHAYFFNIRLSKETKQFLKKRVKLTDRQYYTLWPYTKPGELFDTSPFTGSTSLPLCAPAEKQYPYVLLGQQIKNVFEHDDILDALNPFAGTDYNLRSEFIKVEDSENICEYFEKKNYQSYHHALRDMWNNKELNDIFKDDITLKKLIFNYTHPPYATRQKIVVCLYKYFAGLLSRRMPLKRVQLRVQLALFIILASQEDIDRSSNDQIQLPITPCWIQGDTRNRGPTKITSFTSACFEKMKNMEEISMEEQNEAYNVLVKNYNAYMLETERKDEIIDTTCLKSQTLYADFVRYVDDLSFGNYKGKSFYGALRDPVQQSYVQDDIIFKYLYQQIEPDIFVMNGNEMYYYETDEAKRGRQIQQDHNKFHALKENTIEAKLREKIESLIEGVQKQKHDEMCMKGSNPVILSGEHEWTYAAAFNNRRLRSRAEQQDPDFEEFASKLEAMNWLLKLLSTRARNLANKNALKEFTQKKLESPMGFTMDEEQDVIGVYNGLLLREGDHVRFTTEGRDHFISKSTLFKIRPETVRDGVLIPPEELPADLKEVYDDIINIARGIYANGEDMYVIEWKMYQVMKRMFTKTYPGDYLFIAFGTGSDGKTTFMQAMCNALGLAGFSKQYGNEARRINTAGYTSVAKSTILQTPAGKSSQHDSGGLIELKGNFLQLCAELQESAPLVASSIKQCLGGTQITARGAYKTQTEAFINKCFMELQTNFYPTFDKALENGIERRIVFYKHKVKFIPKAKYDALPEPQKKFHAVADPAVQDRLFNDWRYVDMLGYYIIWNFLRYEHRDIGYVPPELIRQTSLFFSTLCKDMAKCLALLMRTKSDEDFVCYELLEYYVGKIIDKDMDIPASQKLREKMDHMSKIREICKNELRCRNIASGEEEFIAENNFQEKRQDRRFIIIIRGYRFADYDKDTKNGMMWQNMNAQ